MIDVDIEQQARQLRAACALRRRRAGRRPVRPLRARARPALVNAIAGVTKPRARARPHRRCHAVRQRAADRLAAAAAPRRLRVPGRAAVPAPVGRARICSTATGCARRPFASSTRRTSSTCWGSPRCCTAGRARSRAARSSASRSAARCSRSRASCCSTSRSPRSTCRAGRRSSTTSSACATSSASRSSTSAIRWRRSRGSPTRWSCSPTASAWPSATSTTSWDASISSLHTGRYEAGAVIEATRHRARSRFRLTTLRFDGGELTVPGLDASIGERVRARIRARDVSLALAQAGGPISILNVLAGRVTAIQRGIRTGGRRAGRRR